MFNLNLQIVGSSESDDMFKVGTTFNNDYFPLYSQFNNKNITDDVFMYYKPKLSIRSQYNISKYDRLFKKLNYSMNFHKYRFDFNKEQECISLLKGYIVDSNNNILLMVGINKYFDNNLQDALITELEENRVVVKDENYSKFKLFISTEFINNPMYSNIWKKLNSVYVQEYYKKNIPVEFTTSDKIDEMFFGNEFKVKFDSITKLSEHLNNDVIEILKGDYTYVAPIVETTPEFVVDYDESESINLGNVTVESTGNYIYDNTESIVRDNTISNITYTASVGETLTIEADNTVFDNITFQGDVRIQGDNIIVQNSNIENAPQGERYIAGVDPIDSNEDSDFEVVNPNITNVTGNINLLDDTISVGPGIIEQMQNSDVVEGNDINIEDIEQHIDSILGVPSEQQGEAHQILSDTEISSSSMTELSDTSFTVDEQEENESVPIAVTVVDNSVWENQDGEVDNTTIDDRDMEAEAREFFGDDEVDSDEEF